VTEPTAEEGAALVALAVEAIGARLAGRRIEPPVPAAERLTADGSSFVTLERAGRLRGCIGTLDPSRPLYLDVVRNAVRAMADPRLPPVTVAEYADLDVKVSVLTLPEPLPVSGRTALVQALRPGIDGILLTDGTRRATFLPSVWAKLAEPAAFLDALLAKGGWTRWPDEVLVRRYTTVEYASPAPRAALQ
jgi:AmmeMemoRadiSam system protein A